MSQLGFHSVIIQSSPPGCCKCVHRSKKKRSWVIKWQFYSVCPSLPASKHVHTKSDKRGARQLTVENEKKSVKEKVSSRKKITVKPKSRQRDHPKKKSRIYQHIRESHGKNHLNDQEKNNRNFDLKLSHNELLSQYIHGKRKAL